MGSPTCAHSSTTLSSQDVEATSVSIVRGMDKEEDVHRYNAIALSHKKNKIMPTAAT